MSALEDQLDAIFAGRDRENMAPTIDAFEAVRREHPDDPRVVYEVAGSYDTDGQEERAAGLYERALALGLAGELRRRCLLQYGSTLRNLGRLDDSLRVFDEAVAEFPDSISLPVFRALTRHAMGQGNAALAEVMLALVDHVDDPEISRYAAAIRGNAEYVRGLEA